MYGMPNEWRPTFDKWLSPDECDQLELALMRYMERTSGFPRTVGEILTVFAQTFEKIEKDRHG